MENNFSFEMIVQNKSYLFNVDVIYRGAALVKFRLKIKGHELVIQKKLLLKTSSWGVLSSTFEFTEDGAFTLLRIFKILDEKLGTIKPTYDPQKRDKD